MENAREQVAALIGADPREIVWTSGATESNNLALKGAAHFYSHGASTSSRSRPSTRRCWTPCRELERQGFEVTYLDVQADGLLDLEACEAAAAPRHHPGRRDATSTTRSA